MRLTTISLASLVLLSPAACGPKAAPDAPSAPAPVAAAEPAAAPEAPVPVATSTIVTEVVPAPAPVEPDVVPPTSPEAIVITKTTHEEDWVFQPDDKQRTFKTMFQRPDGSLIALGGSNEPGVMQITMTALSPNGELLWDKVHGDRHSLAAWANGGGAPLGDGSFLVVGTVMLTDLTYQVWVGRFDADGALSWEAKLGESEAWATANWIVPLGDKEALMSVSRGDAAKPDHTLVKVSLSDGAIIETLAAPGQVERPERDPAGRWTTLVWNHDGDSPKSATYTVDAATGALTPAPDAPAPNWQGAGGSTILVTSAPLVDGGRVLVTRDLGETPKVTFVTTDASGAVVWRKTIEEAGTEQVGIVIGTSPHGFAYVGERWETDDNGLRDPAGSRIVWMD